MLCREGKPASRWQRLIEALLVRACFAPLTLMAVGLVWVGILSLGPRKDFPEIWICLPAGLILLALLQGILWWVTIWLPRHTVTRFVLDEKDLALETLAHGPFVCSLPTIEKTLPSRNRRGSITGWWIRCRKEGWVYLNARIPNAQELAAALVNRSAPSPM